MYLRTMNNYTTMTTITPNVMFIFSINKYTYILVPNTYLTKIIIPQTQICEPQIYSTIQIVGNSDTNPN